MGKFFWIILGVTIAILIGLFAIFNNDGSNPAPINNEQPLELTDQEHTKGSRESGVQLIEYGDFQCPACKAAHPLVKQAMDEYGDKIGITFRHFPLTNIHPNAFAGARAVEAAGTQGKFFEMHNILFERQDEWATSSSPKAKFQEYAQELSLNIDQFNEVYESNATRDRINRDISSGQKAEVGGTPTFYLNGQKLENPGTYQELKDKIDEQLRL